LRTEKNHIKICEFCQNKTFDKTHGLLCNLKIDNKNITDNCSGYSEKIDVRIKYNYGQGVYRKINDDKNLYHFPDKNDSIDSNKVRFKENFLKSKWFLAFIILNTALIIDLFQHGQPTLSTKSMLIYLILNIFLITFFVYRYFIIQPFILLDKDGLKIRRQFLEWIKINRIYIWQKRKPRTEVYNFNIGFYDYYLMIETYGKTYIFEITQTKTRIDNLNKYIDNYRKTKPNMSYHQKRMRGDWTLQSRN
jgi:hypothetical protein